MSTHSAADNGEARYQEANRENRVYRDHYRNMLDKYRPGLLTSLGHSTGSIVYSELGNVLKYLLNYVCLHQQGDFPTLLHFYLLK